MYRYYYPDKLQLRCLQHIQNALARAVVAAPRSSNTDHILRSLLWLKIQERIEYKVISTTCKLLQSSSPCYLHDLITVQSFQSTWSSALVTVLQPSVHSSLKFINCSFWHAASHLWNKLPPTLCILYQFDPSSPNSSPLSRSDPGPVVDISHGIFHPRLKTFLFLKSFPLSIPQADYHWLFGSHWRQQYWWVRQIKAHYNLVVLTNLLAYFVLISYL